MLPFALLDLNASIYCISKTFQAIDKYTNRQIDNINVTSHHLITSGKILHTVSKMPFLCIFSPYCLPLPWLFYKRSVKEKVRWLNALQENYIFITHRLGLLEIPTFVTSGRSHKLCFSCTDRELQGGYFTMELHEQSHKLAYVVEVLCDMLHSLHSAAFQLLCSTAHLLLRPLEMPEME